MAACEVWRWQAVASQRGSVIRCYLMRGSSIASVVILSQGQDDELINQAMAAFEKNARHAYDGFEVWHEKRSVYRYTAATKTGETSPT